MTAASAWAVGLLRQPRPNYGPLSSVAGRSVLMALATLADEALDSPNGCTDTLDAHVATLVGLAPSTVLSWLRTLEADELAVRVSTHRFRVPEVAFA